MTSEVNDPLFEAFYTAFLMQMKKGGEKPAILPTALGSIPEEYRERAFERWSKRVVTVSPVVVLTDRTPLWRAKYSSADGRHWIALKNYLLTHGGRTADQIDNLDAASDKVLFSIGDPLSAEEKTPGAHNQPEATVEAYKGLVVGYVQSGKTANYTALTAKAFDAGYQLVIVLTGIHNALRRQTQRRMNNELGILDSTDDRPTARSFDPNSEAGFIHSLTGEGLVDGDFKYHELQPTILNTGKFLIVTKKNANVLASLIRWLGTVRVPTLIIDDEADQASVNTKGPGKKTPLVEGDISADGDPNNDPTVINRQIRKLVKKCKGGRAYVGYTATPYANVFISQDAFDPRYEEDLFPDDFIVSLEKPAGYMGPEEFFGLSGSDPEDSASTVEDLVVEIVDEEDARILSELNPANVEHKPNIQGELPSSLVGAVRNFILMTAVRRAVSGKPEPSSCLIHTSHKQEEQVVLAKAVERLIKSFVGQWRNDRVSAEASFERDFDEWSRNTTDPVFKVEFSQIRDELDSLLGRFGAISTLLLNHKSPDELDYDLNPELVAVIIGGNKLSRGLTLEGLITSYFLRHSSNPLADTLTQMGRFFGFREHLVAVTKVYTTDRLREAFRDVSLVESSLRRELENLARLGLRPRDFAPRVRKMLHLLPTARNKMRAAKEFGRTYSGDLIQTTSFPSGADIHKANVVATRTLLKSFSDDGIPRQDHTVETGEVTRWLWSGVDAKHILKYLKDFKTVRDANRFSSELILGYITDQMKPISVDGKPVDPELTKWNVLVLGRQVAEDLGTESFGLEFKLGRISRGLVKGSNRSVKSIITPIGLTGNLLRGDELLDFDPEDLQALQEEANIQNQDSSGDALAARARRMRDPSTGLLMIYPISPNSVRKSKTEATDKTIGQTLFPEAKEDITIVGLALVFPYSESEDLADRQYWAVQSRESN